MRMKEYSIWNGSHERLMEPVAKRYGDEKAVRAGTSLRRQMKHLSILIALAIQAAAHENHIQPVIAPEPSTVILMGTGVAMLVAWQWRKKRK